MSRNALAFLALALVAAGGTVFALALREPVATALSQPEQEPGHAAERILPAEPLEEFQFTAQSGQEFSSTSLDGEVWIASFFFATCPGTCRSQNQQIAALQARYGDQGVKFVAISVDPARDDPGALRSYAQGFAAKPDQWYFLTDRSRTIDYTKRVGEEIFKVPVNEKGHADTLILVGRSGAIHDYYNWKKPARMADLRKDIESLLAEEVPAESEADAVEGEAEQSEASEETSSDEADDPQPAAGEDGGQGE